MDRTSYAPTELPLHGRGAVIRSVEPGGPAARAGIIAGEVIVRAAGSPLRDIIDWQWVSDESAIDLVVRDSQGAEREVLLERVPGEAWGLEFESVLFDGVRTCRNSCSFCFMTQLPKGLRPALYVRDDDYRLSFLQGNFVTLTNLSDDDVARIAEQHLSPLYVSLHAVDPLVRRELVCARDDRALERFDQLVEAGIDMHVQVVLVPGVNDSERLDETLTWLAEREGVVSVGVVPLGYTAHQETFSASYNDPIAAATVIQQVQRWQFAMKERDGVSWVHLADEFYLNARAPVPTTPWYDGFPQYENGIGIVRSFVDDAMELRPELERAVLSLAADAESATFVTGVMSATTMAGALNACEAVGRVRLLVVPNHFFGGNVTVTGLLTGGDIAEAIRQDTSRLDRPTAYLVPDIIFNADGITLDDLSFDDIVSRSGADMRLVSSDAAGMLEGLRDVAQLPPLQKE